MSTYLLELLLHLLCPFDFYLNLEGFCQEREEEHVPLRDADRLVQVEHLPELLPLNR